MSPLRFLQGDGNRADGSASPGSPRPQYGFQLSNPTFSGWRNAGRATFGLLRWNLSWRLQGPSGTHSSEPVLLNLTLTRLAFGCAMGCCIAGVITNQLNWSSLCGQIWGPSVDLA